MALNEPRVTVGMPVYNDPSGLRRSVPSIMNQTWRGPFRLLVVDDGSTDDTPEVLASLAETYPGVEIVRSPANEGRPFARNRIVELAGDDYLAWCDSGDLWHPRKLELQLAALLDAEQEDSGTRFLCTGSVHWVQADTGHTRIRIPDITGDQLRSGLEGTIFPYLQGIVGRADHFRSLGGFDQRLLRRQDYDFLVRFIGAGGRVVAAPPDIPVFTYFKSYAGGSATAVARANRVIRRKHQSFYERYGRSLQRHIRGNQHRLVARFYSNNGREAHARAFRMLAWLASPTLADPARGAARVLRPRRRARAMAAAVIQTIQPVLPALRRSRLVGFARRAGLDRALNRSAVRRLYYEQLPSTANGGEPLSPSFQDDMPAAPAGWLRLEQTYRERGLLHSAEAALRQGLEQYPGDAALLARLLELLALRRRWADCVALWSKQANTESPSFRALTYARVARAYRHLDHRAEALAVVGEGLRRWPHHKRLLDEHYVNRADSVDWMHAVGQSADGNTDQATEPIGVVTALGSLAGRSGPVEGRITIPGAAPPTVSLVVNGMPVAKTSARRPPDGDLSTFALNCDDLRIYLGDGDVLAVECDGRPLLIEDHGFARTIHTGYESRFLELEQMLRAGHVFTKFGTLKMGSTPETKAQTLDLYNEISTILTESWAYPAFPFYGNLLGAIREHDIIAHDVGGFDMGYVSSHHDPGRVRAEFMDICRALLDRGYHLRLEPWSVYVRPSRGSRIFVDVNYAWFTAAGELQLSFGWRHAPVTDRERFFYPRESMIGRHPVRVPGNAEAVLEQIYGPSWAIPDQGFALEADLRRERSYLLSEDEMRSLESLDPDRVEARLDHYHEDSEMIGVDLSSDE